MIKKSLILIAQKPLGIKYKHMITFIIILHLILAGSLTWSLIYNYDYLPVWLIIAMVFLTGANVYLAFVNIVKLIAS